MYMEQVTGISSLFCNICSVRCHFSQINKTAQLTTKSSTGAFLSVRALSGSIPVFCSHIYKAPLRDFIYMEQVTGIFSLFCNICSVRCHFSQINKTAPLATKSFTGAFLLARALPGSIPVFCSHIHKAPFRGFMYMEQVTGIEPAY